MTMLTLKSNFSLSVLDIKLKFSGLSYQSLHIIRTFLSDCEMGHVYASQILHHFMWNDPKVHIKALKQCQ